MRKFLFPVLALLLLYCGCAYRSPAVLQEELPPPPPAEPAPSVPEDLQPEDPTQPPAVPEEPAAADFVRVCDYIPAIEVQLAYAGTDNFTGQVIYDFTDAWLRWGTVQKLSAVQEDLARQGYGLLIWDAFRPVSAQFKLWEICPDPVYVADPNRGFSSHSRGNTVDVTLITATGEAVEMPTGFDDFTPLADRDYSDIAPGPASNAQLLEDTMLTHGFNAYQGEWWHFSDSDSYDVEESFIP